MATAVAAPSSSKTIDTVVDVGRPKVLNRSSSRTSASMTARKITITSANVNSSGLKMPLRATSMIPDENIDPAKTPAPATIRIIRRVATRLPIAELRKFTASLLTPTLRSSRASRNSSPTATSK